MAQVKMYSKKDKRFVNFPIACTPSDDECKKCQLEFTCDKAKIKIYGWSDLKKWFWDRFCFPRRKLVAEWLHCNKICNKSKYWEWA